MLPERRAFLPFEYLLHWEVDSMITLMLLLSGASAVLGSSRDVAVRDAHAGSF